MTQTLDELVEAARKWRAEHPMTDEERREQAISFAYGNLVLDGCKVTREMIEAEYDKLHGEEADRG